jgi:NAD(P)-dependent dehydrogenase (short-subunit alcohol dehydrogenase family)
MKMGELVRNAAAPFARRPAKRALRWRTAGIAAAGIAAAGAGAWWARRSHHAWRALRRQVALVTGGSRGLGFLVADELARAGCAVAICARDAAELAEARRQLAAHGHDVATFVCDVGDEAAVRAMVEGVSQQFGRIDVVVNNAGIIEVAPIEALNVADFHAAMNVSFWGTVHVTLAVLPQMRARHAGRIVNVTSIGGEVAVPHLVPYDSAKFAAVGFSEGVRAEVAADGVQVTTVVPGLMRTGSQRFAHFGGRAEKERAWFSTAAQLPGVTVGARRAARRIVHATARGATEPVIGTPARLLRLAKRLAPRFTLRSLGVAARLMPRATAPAP